DHVLPPPRPQLATETPCYQRRARGVSARARGLSGSTRRVEPERGQAGAKRMSRHDMSAAPSAHAPAGDTPAVVLAPFLRQDGVGGSGRSAQVGLEVFSFTIELAEGPGARKTEIQEVPVPL